ncbi:MAG TPA: membrane protein insertase YidC [Alphaproteobacteria bacterium]|nr:membrane protein insertase YidC [Alphaproteobacteria bacterium]
MAEYRNPHHEPGAEKRPLIALLVAFVGIALMQYFLPKPQPAPQPQQQKQAEASPGQKPATTTATAAPASPQKAPASAAVSPVAVKRAEAEAETVIDSPLYRIVLVNRGAMVKSWVLKNYKDGQGKPQEMVNATSVATVGSPLSLFTYDKDLQNKLNQALFVASTSDPITAPGSITFEFADSETQARKTLRFDSTYVISLEVEVTHKGQKVQAYPIWHGGLGDQSTAASYGSTKIDWQQDNNIEHKSAFSGFFLTGKKWVVGGQTLNGPFQWAGVSDQYFVAAFLPESPRSTAIVTLHDQIDLPKNPSKPEDTEKIKVSVLGVAVGDTGGVTRERLFVGPKAVDILDGVQSQKNGPNLRGILDFGIFGFIARPLFLWLKWTHDHWIPNWGWAIAFLTVVITAALLPLRITGMKSALKMQKLQPQIKAINEKYKRYSITDPRRAEMQKEMSALYKREGVNPLGGCFPLLLQMPFLIAFYSMLNNAIELRHADWLWIHDLSSPDPLYILPIAITITMFLTQKSTPQAGMDPAQQKMLAFMSPLMMGYFSLLMPSGTGVYWGISNIISYIQQIVINRSQFGQQVRKGVERRATRKR